MARQPRQLARVVAAADLPDAAAIDAYVGPAGELIADHIRGLLMLHDGSTPGGIRLARANQLFVGTFGYIEEVIEDDDTITLADLGKCLVADKSTAIAFAFDPAGDLGPGFVCMVKNIGAGPLTLNPDGAEEIDGASTVVLPTGAAAVVKCDGTELRTYLSTGDLSGKASITGVETLTNKTLTAPVLNKPEVNEPLGEFLRGYMSGLKLTNDAGDVSNDIATAAGSAASDGATPVLMTLASSMIKRIDANWAAGTNQGGLDTGAVTNATYYEWLIQRSDTGAEDILISLSATAPTMPADYDRKALIGKFARVGGVNQVPRSYSEKEGTDWVAFTPVFTGFGTVASSSMFSRRVGDSLEIMGTFVNGTPTAVEARMSLGTGLTSDASKVPALRHCGSVLRGAAAAVSYHALIESGVGYITFSRHDGSNNPLTKMTGSQINGGETVSINASIPIAGW